MRTATPISRSAQPASARARSRPVAVLLEEQRDRAHPLERGDGLDPVGGVDHRLVPGRDDGVEADPPAHPEGVDGDVAALGDQRDRRRPGGARPSRPRAASATATETTPLQFGPQTGRPPASAIAVSSRSSSRPGLDLAEPGGEDDRAAAAALDRFGEDRRRRPPPGSRPRPRRPAPADRRRSARRAVRAPRSRFGLTPQTSPSNPAAARLRRMLSP